MTSVLTLVLSSNLDPYDRILSEGQEKTWIRDARRDGFQVLPYLASSSVPIDVAVRRIEKKLSRHERINRLGLNAVRAVRRSPGSLSRELIALNVPTSTLDERHGRIYSSIADSLATIGLRTLEAFQYALKHYSFDYLARTNTSSYVDVDRLSRLLPEKPSDSKVFALQGTWGRMQYPSGALYVLSRQTVELVVHNASDWQHEYMDDVALGLLLARHIKNLEYEDVPRFDFPFTGEQKDPYFPATYVHYRCKSSNWRFTVSRHSNIHAKKNSWG